MTRGRRPIKALIEAELIALQRGTVHLTQCGRTNPVDLIIIPKNDENEKNREKD